MGEAEPEILFPTTTNPKFRKLLRVNINDIEYTKDIFSLLHSKGEEVRKRRREFIDSAELSYADIDN